jgi:transposase
MAKGYSEDLRERAVAMVEEGESRREVARLLNLAPSTTVRWFDQWRRTGSVSAKPGTGHSRSPLKAYERWLRDLVEKEPDLTLEEIRDRLRREKKLAVATSSVWRFYDRHKITFKKKSCTRPSRIDPMSLPPASS